MNAIVTGASRGLGKQIATAFYRQGANVLLAGRSRADLNRLLEGLAAESLSGQNVAAVVVDLCDPKGPAEVLAEARRRWEKLDNGGASPEEAAALAVFLASPASAGITGRLISAVWDTWRGLPEHIGDLRASDIYTLRRIIPADRGKNWQ
jgi:3-oxoacyl-[acyl-carrier protein] reductase